MFKIFFLYIYFLIGLNFVESSLDWKGEKKKTTVGTTIKNKDSIKKTPMIVFFFFFASLYSTRNVYFYIYIPFYRACILSYRAFILSPSRVYPFILSWKPFIRFSVYPVYQVVTV